jgi:hypothetical protein
MFNIIITPDNNEQAVNFSLFPFDVINIRKMAVRKNRRWLQSRCVNYAGNMFWPAKAVTYCKRAGSLTSVANIEGVKIKRPIQAKTN